MRAPLYGEQILLLFTAIFNKKIRNFNPFYNDLLYLF